MSVSKLPLLFCQRLFSSEKSWQTAVCARTSTPPEQILKLSTKTGLSHDTRLLREGAKKRLLTSATFATGWQPLAGLSKPARRCMVSSVPAPARYCPHSSRGCTSQHCSYSKTTCTSTRVPEADGKACWNYWVQTRFAFN